MNGFRRLIIISLLSISSAWMIGGCATNATEGESETASAEAENPAVLDATPSTNDNLEAEFKALDTNSDAKPEEKDEFSEFEKQPEGQDALALNPPAPEIQEPPPPIVDTPPTSEPPAEAMNLPTPTGHTNLVTIRGIQYKANENGGTIIIDGDGPMTYSTRMNSTNGQYIIDVPNTFLAKKLTRPLITKDFEGHVGSIDAYQSPGSNVSRIIVHLRPGAFEPVIQTEGNSILVVANTPKEFVPAEQVKLLSYNSLEEFLSGNMVFSGKKISIETNDMDISDFLNFISEEGGINLVLGDGIAGKVNVKLRQVPWDQALVMIMRAKKLSYTKTGNILRIAQIADIKAEEDQVVKSAEDKKNVEPLKVKLFPISYAKIDDLEKQLKPFISKRGSIVGDNRTHSLVVSDISDNLERVLKVIQNIDIPPQQVLIDGKIVEATDNFDKQMGIQWSASGKSYPLGDFRSTTSIAVTPGSATGSTGSINFNLGTMDFFGDLAATLTIRESEGSAKVLSSPRVVTLHNETAEISQTQEIPIITSTVSASGAVSPSVSFKPVKLKLGVTPQITNDGGVIMGVDVNRDFLGDIADVATQARPVNSRTAKTKVLVKNGQTAVIGGVYQNDDSSKETRVPWFGNLPVVGWLFKTKSRTTQKNELLIFLTPRILGQLDSQTIPQTQGGEL